MSTILARLRANRDGAVFLLSVYFTALTLLLLGGVALQRTMTENRWSTLSRDVEQSFWLAEAALDGALTQAKRQPLLDGIAYPVQTLHGNAQFILETTSGEILPPTRTKPTRQRLERRVIATGTTSTGVSSSVSGMYREEGPATGVWGNGVVVAAGGRAYRSIFLTGAMHSLSGALSAVVEGANPGYSFWSMVFGVPRSGSVFFRGLGYVANKPPQQSNKAALEAKLSGELRSIQEGYQFIKGTLIGDQGENDTGLRYVITPVEDAIANVSGAGSVGLIKPISPVDVGTVFPRGKYNPQLCAGNLFLNGGQPFAVSGPAPMVIDDGFNDGGGVKDLTPASGKITLCVNSIIPDPDNWWGWAMTTTMNDPPAIVFRQPTTIYVTGSYPIDFERMSAGGLLGEPSMAGLIRHMGATEIQTAWNVSVGAKLSAVDQAGRRIPGGIQIIATRTPTPGVIWVEPGKFSGSIYAPQSLVIIRERDRSDVRWEGNVQVPLELWSVVGNEVTIELEDDEVTFGYDQSSANDKAATTTQLLNWFGKALYSDLTRPSATSTTSQ